MQVRAIRTAIADVLANISGLNTYDRVVSDFKLPAALVFPPDTITYGLTFGSRGSRLMIPIRLYIGRSQDEGIQDRLDALISDEGTSSVKLILEAYSNLGGLVDYVLVREARNYGPYPVDNVLYIGAEIIVEVMT